MTSRFFVNQVIITENFDLRDRLKIYPDIFRNFIKKALKICQNPE